jgi:hypothetical protein
MIQEYANLLATQMGLKLDKVLVTDGQSLGCKDATLLSLCVGNKLVSEFIYQADLLPSGEMADAVLTKKIKSAIDRLLVS